jgi:hypothetical protein
MSLMPHTPRPPRPSSRRSRAALLATLAASLGVSTACYTSRPVMSAPEPGATAVVSLNDRGRVALGDAIGANADRVEGSVVSRSDSAFVLAVRTVDYFGGASNEWKGEHVTVPVAGVRGMSEKRYSRARTYLAAGTLAAAVVAFIVTRNVLGESGALIEDPGSGNPPAGSFVPVRP